MHLHSFNFSFNIFTHKHFWTSLPVSTFIPFRFHWHSKSPRELSEWIIEGSFERKENVYLCTHCFISSVILRLFSMASSVSYSLQCVLVSKRNAFFLISAVVVGQAAEGSLMMGIMGTLQFKVISAAIPDDFLLIPTIPSFSSFDVMIGFFSRFNLVNIQCWKDDMRRWISRGRIKRQWES